MQFITSLKPRLPFVLELRKPTNRPELLRSPLRKTRLLQEVKRSHLQILINHVKSLMLTSRILKLAHLKVKRSHLHSGLLINGLKSQPPKSRLLKLAHLKVKRFHQSSDLLISHLESQLPKARLLKPAHQEVIGRHLWSGFRIRNLNPK